MAGDDCMSATLRAAATGAAAGAVGGAIKSNWGDVPLVLRNQAWPALKRTGAIMRQFGLVLGFVGAAFAGTECLAESVRGRKDMLNGVLGGVAAGGVLGTALGRMPVGVGAAALLAATSMTVDLSGHSLKGTGMINDGVTPPRLIFPYPEESNRQ